MIECPKDSQIANKNDGYGDYMEKLFWAVKLKKLKIYAYNTNDINFKANFMSYFLSLG